MTGTDQFADVGPVPPVENTRPLARLPQFGLHVQRFVWFEAKSFHYICFWIIFEGSLSLSFSRRICWWSLGFETQRVRIS